MIGTIAKPNGRYVAIAFACFLALWTVWATDIAMRFVAPGLLDDGSHIPQGNDYWEHGFFRILLLHLRDIFDPQTTSRFYEVHRALLGIYTVAFGLDLRYWYLANLSMCVLTAAAGYWIVRSATGSVSAGILCVFAVLTVSPLADAARANFGKVEVAMTFAFVLGAACLSSVLENWRPRFTMARALRMGALALGCVAAFTVAVLAKESGKILATFLLLFPLLEIYARFAGRGPGSADGRFAGLERWVFGAENSQAGRAPIGLLVASLIVGAGLLAFSAYVFRLRQQTGYLANYFSLNFDTAFVTASLRYYWTQSTDEMIMLAVLAPVVVLGAWRGRRAWSWTASLTVIAGVYMALLLTFRYQVSYYVYVPAVLTAVAFAIAFTQVSRRYKIIMLLALILSRIHSIPHIYFQAAAQRYADFINFKAMEFAADTGAPRIIILDVDERNQLIQEWNLLRQYFLDDRVPPIIGGPPEFKIWEYQQHFRDLSRRKHPFARGPSSVGSTGLPPDQINAEPQVGDVVAFRSGTMLAGRIALRAILPFVQDETLPLASVDRQSLVAMGSVGGQPAGVTPWRWGIGKFDYKWHFFRVASEPRYLIFGQGLHGWMMQEARLRVNRSQAGHRLVMTFEVPEWLPIRYPVTIAASSGERVVATIVAAQAGYYKLVVPLDLVGDTKIGIDKCITAAELQVDSHHPYCYRLIETAEEGRGN